MHSVKTPRSIAKLPVTILSGFLGSGKTTLLKHILENRGSDMRIAVIVNDMAELNIDASLVKQGSLVQTEEKLIEMQNGCICCTLREDLLIEIKRLASMAKFDYVLIESTGIGEPQQVAETFELDIDDSDAASLSSVAFIDTMVTVVDSSNLLNNLSSIKNLAEQEGRDIDDLVGGERNVADLLLDQIEFANVILLNKTDLISSSSVLELQAFLKALNPGANIIPCVESNVPVPEIVNTRLFNMEKARESAGWLLSLKEGHTPETEEYGISSFIYRARSPFHPTKLWNLVCRFWMIQEMAPAEHEDDDEEPDFEIRSHKVSQSDMKIKSKDLKSEFGEILRSKGFLWLAGRNDLHGELSQAGSILRISPGAPWFASIPEELWEGVDPEDIKKDMVGEHGDRRQEIVFIGVSMKKDTICQALDACLCSHTESVDRSDDPFMPWPMLEIVSKEHSESESEEEHAMPRRSQRLRTA